MEPTEPTDPAIKNDENRTNKSSDDKLKEQHPIVKDRWDVTIIKSIFTKGLLPPSQRTDEIATPLQSATSTTPDFTIHGNILVPKLEVEYDENKNELRLAAPTYDTDTKQLYRPIKYREDERFLGKPYDRPRSYWRRYQRYTNGDRDPELVEEWDSKLDPVKPTLYAENFGALSVIAERPWITPRTSMFGTGSPTWERLELEDVEDMMAQSFLIVAKYDKVYKERGDHSIFNAIVLSPLEYQTPDAIPPEDFEYILIPGKLRGVFERLDLGSMREKIKYVGETTARVSYGDKWANYPMKVPDYEKALREIIAERSDDVFWLHGVRLPARVDYVHKAQEEEQQPWKELVETRRSKPI